METVKELACLRCDHTWLPRTAQKPDCCPACKNRNWNKHKNKKDSKGVLRLTGEQS